MAARKIVCTRLSVREEEEEERGYNMKFTKHIKKNTKVVKIYTQANSGEL